MKTLPTSTTTRIAYFHARRGPPSRDGLARLPSAKRNVKNWCTPPSGHTHPQTWRPKAAVRTTVTAENAKAASNALEATDVVSASSGSKWKKRSTSPIAPPSTRRVASRRYANSRKKSVWLTARSSRTMRYVLDNGRPR